MALPRALSADKTATITVPGVSGTKNQSVLPVCLVRHDGSIDPSAISNAAALNRLFRNGAGSFNIHLSTTGTVGTPDVYFVQPPPGQIYLIQRLTWHFVDGTVTMGDFGGIPQLTNGCLFTIEHGTVAAPVIDHDPLDGLLLQNNRDFHFQVGDFDIRNEGANDDSLVARFNVDGFVGRPLELDGDGDGMTPARSTRAAYKIRDSMAGLTIHRVKAYGLVITKSTMLL